MGLVKKEKTRIVFRCKKTQEEIIKLLKKPEFADNIEYNFEETAGGYRFGVTKVPLQIGTRRPVYYALRFEQGQQGLYLLVEEEEAKSIFVTSSQEPELYRFFIEKCDCEPAADVE